MQVLLADGIATLSSTTDSTAARNAADMLGTFQRPSAIPALSAAASRSDLSPEARAHVARALGRIGHLAGNPALEAALRDSSAQVRLEAVLAWGEILHQADAAPVAALVNDSDLSVQRAAAGVVGMFDQSSARASLEQVLTSSSDAAARRNAAWALGQIGDSASRDVLTAATNDGSSLVRMTAKAALRNLR
jgi:HEAT repeat protein